jgi:hypothetical protein
MLTRFDFTKNQRDLLNAAVSCGLVDAIELACMVTNHGNNMDALLDELSEVCWVLRTGSDNERETRSQWVNACDQFRAL